jgi:protein O-GlcNAc transferase
VLWLLQDNPAAQRNLQQEAQARGIAAERLVFAGRLPLDQHLARHRLADLFIDTLPYNAHTTASDALWAGLPVLTCIGSSFAGRVAASLLHAIGLPELVAASMTQYEALALRLATQPALLKNIKDKLQRNRQHSALFDADRFRQHIEEAYRRMWQTAQAGNAPRGFAVAQVA